MANSRKPQEPPKGPVRTQEHLRASIDRLERRLAELEKFDPKTVTHRFSSPEVKAIEAAIDETLSRVFGHGTNDYNRYSRAKSLDHGNVYIGAGDDPPPLVQRYLAEGKREAIALLNQAIRGLEEDLEHTAPSSPSPSDPRVSRSPGDSRRVFIVHGHDEGAREAVARFLEKLGLEAIILLEKPNSGRTLIEKLEAHSDAGYVIVLATPDDEGRAVGKDLQHRARQNVILELGFFAGALGRKRVCLLVRDKIELPSDMLGIAWHAFDDHGAWRQKLASELQEAGFTIDWNIVMARS